MSRRATKASSFLSVLFLIFLILCCSKNPGTESTSKTVPIEPEMVKIPGGSFWMGASSKEEENSFSGNYPRHQVTVEAFCIGKYEVTVGQFKAFVKDTGYKTEAERGVKVSFLFERKQKGSEPTDPNWRNPEYPQNDSHPVACVSWNDAQKYCKWLRDKTERNYRLPTEKEWEYACRARSESKYFWGNKLEQGQCYGNFGDHSLKEAMLTPRGGIEETTIPKGRLFVPWNDGYANTSPIGSFKPNAFGIYDIEGNVTEWCEDKWIGDYSGKMTDLGPLGALGSPHFSVEDCYIGRGSSFENCMKHSCSSSRWMYNLRASVQDIGFRVAADFDK